MIPSEAQASFFGRITQALADRGEPIALPEDLEPARVIGRGKNLLEVFTTRVEQAGMHPHRVKGEDAVAAKVAEIAQSLGARSAILPDEPIPARDEILVTLRSKGVQIADAEDPHIAFDVDLGITSVARAVAETASMSVLSGEGHRRLASLAVPAHIAVVRADEIVADLLDWGQAPLPDTPANEVLISAMSKTADIEGILVPGVHGPGVVHVIIVE